MKWEYFLDHSYYDMYAVRPEGDKDFNSPRLFHVVAKHEAEKLCEYLNDSYETDVAGLLLEDSWTHLLTGLAAETGEVCGVFQKSLYKNQPVDNRHLISEMGDVLFYLTAMCNKLNITMDDLKSSNISKLKERRSTNGGK